MAAMVTAKTRWLHVVDSVTNQSKYFDVTNIAKLETNNTHAHTTKYTKPMNDKQLPTLCNLTFTVSIQME